MGETLMTWLFALSSMYAEAFHPLIMSHGAILAPARAKARATATATTLSTASFKYSIFKHPSQVK